MAGYKVRLGDGSEIRVGFVPSALLPTDHLSSPVADTGWWLGADAAPLIEAARAEGRTAILQFRRVFALGAAAPVTARDYSRQGVEISVTYQRYDPGHPWTKRRPSSEVTSRMRPGRSW